MKERFAPKNVIPESHREWKQRKRREWRAVMKAANDFLQGAAYTPADWHGVDDKGKPLPLFYPGVLESLENIKKRLSIKEWGR